MFVSSLKLTLSVTVQMAVCIASIFATAGEMLPTALRIFSTSELTVPEGVNNVDSSGLELWKFKQ